MFQKGLQKCLSPACEKRGNEKSIPGLSMGKPGDARGSGVYGRFLVFLTVRKQRVVAHACPQGDTPTTMFPKGTASVTERSNSPTMVTSRV